jgi:hypothetical protein
VVEASEGGELGPADLKRMRDHFLSNNPSSSVAAQTLIIAMGICAELLGRDWLVRNLSANRRSSANYFPKLLDPADEYSHFLWEYRLVDLAKLLYQCQRLPGFFDSLADIRKHDLRGVAGELRVAYLFHRSGHTPRFVHRSCAKRQDYDLEVSVGDAIVAVEVKSKEQSTPLNEGTILSTVKDARQQLPKEGPGIVVLVLPDDWVRGTQVDGRVVAAVTKAVRKSARINMVIILWEAVFESESSLRAVATSFFIVKNEQPRQPVEEMYELLRVMTSSGLDQFSPPFLLDLPPD